MKEIARVVFIYFVIERAKQTRRLCKDETFEFHWPSNERELNRGILKLFRRSFFRFNM